MAEGLELEEIRRRLGEALKLRIPLMDPSTPPRQRVSQLEEHILKCAYHSAECEEALHWVIEIGKTLRAEWDGVEGYQQLLGSKPTKDQIDQAKAKVKPDIWTGLQECRSLTESLRRQCARLGGSDYDAASRAYTMLSGS